MFVLPAVTSGENCDEAIFVTSKAKNVGMATVTARLFNAGGGEKSPSKIIRGGRGEYSVLFFTPTSHDATNDGKQNDVVAAIDHTQNGRIRREAVAYVRSE